MSSCKTLNKLLLQDKISSGDIRYMSEETKQDILNKTSACTGTLREKIFWLQNGLTEYPHCKACDKSLTSKQFRTNIQGGLYYIYCSRKCAARDPDLNNIKKETVRVKYGTEYYLASNDARKKIEHTNILRYNSKSPHPWGSQTFKNLIFEKYGVYSPREIDSIDKRIIKNQIISNIDSGRTELSINACEAQRNVKCINREIANDYNRAPLEQLELLWQHSCGKTYISPIINGLIKVCPHCTNSASILELSLRSMVSELTANFIIKDTSVLNKRELDIYLPDKKLALEFNGIYWHSVLRNEDKFYHLNKTEQCLEKGIKLIHIWENDFLNKYEIVRSIVKNAMHSSDIKIYARKCQIKEISGHESAHFLNENHLHGSISSKIKLGLFFNDELVEVMTFGKSRFNKNIEWEVQRLCSKLNTEIIGGASKLFKYFLKKYDPPSIISYADRSFGEGDVYLKLGFKKLQPTQPNYFWANINSAFTISRYQSQKHKLHKLLGNKFDNSLTEVENMKQLGWFKLYNCGNNKFIYLKNQNLAIPSSNTL